MCIKVYMIEVRQTEDFALWLASLRDDVAAKRIKQRIARVQIGLFGDAKSVGGGLSELRIDHGPGYRVYFIRRGDVLVILLCGGDKGDQARDISRAKAMAEQLED
jgi:putative addiction module killer protein